MRISMRIVNVVSAAVIRECELLMVRKGSFWILPGGKPRLGEKKINCLRRELAEELSGTQLERMQYYGEFRSNVIHDYKIAVSVFHANLHGELYSPSGEISEVKWINDFEKHKLSEATSKIINSLRKDRYL